MSFWSILFAQSTNKHADSTKLNFSPNSIYIIHVNNFCTLFNTTTWSLAAFHYKFHKSQSKSRRALFFPPLFHCSPSLVSHSFKHDIQNRKVIVVFFIRTLGEHHNTHCMHNTVALTPTSSHFFVLVTSELVVPPSSTTLFVLPFKPYPFDLDAHSLTHDPARFNTSVLPSFSNYNQSKTVFIYYTVARYCAFCAITSQMRTSSFYKYI